MWYFPKYGCHLVKHWSEVQYSLPEGVRPDVTTLVTGNTEQGVTQTRNCTATSSRREGTKLWFNAMEEKTGDKGSIGFLHNSTQCQGHSSLDAPSELNLPQRIPSPLLLHY